MAFLNPAALWGLLALSVPIIVHFFNLQRPRQVLFSNVAFVKEVKRTVVRRVNFQRWLLLLLRLLALAAIVFVFANPVKVESGKQLLQGSRSVAIIVDNSESMRSSNERGEYFRQAISLSRNLVKAYGQEDEFLVTGSSNLSLQSGFTGKDEIGDHLEQLSLEQNTRSLGDLLGVAPNLFDRSSGAVKELYIISDFQESTILTDSTELLLSDSTILVRLLPVASRQPDNVYIEDHRVVSKILAQDRPVSFQLSLVNGGKNAVQDLNVRIVLENTVVAISNQSLEAGEKKPIDLSFIPNKSGWLAGYIELDDQPIDFDNKRFFSLYVPSQEKVLLVESQSSPNIKLLYEDVFKQFETKIISDRSLASVNFQDYRSIVWTGLNRLSTGLASQLTEFVNNGGSLLVFPGETLDGPSWNSWLGSMKIGQIDSKAEVKEGVEARSYDLEHPVFEGVYTSEQARANPDYVRVFKYYPLALSGALPQARILSVDNRTPLLVENSVGAGQLFLFSFFSSNSWSDLQVKTIFPPLLFRITQLMNQSGNLTFDQEIGAFAPLELKASTQQRLDLRNEKGETFTPERYEQAGRSRLVFDNMSLDAGNYDIVQEDTVLMSISFNVSDQESKLKFAEKEELEELIEGKGLEDQIMILSALDREVTDELQQARDGIPLWKWFLWGAVICMLIEVIILGGSFSKFFRKTPATAN